MPGGRPEGDPAVERWSAAAGSQTLMCNKTLEHSQIHVSRIDLSNQD
jgi:hypothetical protein